MTDWAKVIEQVCEKLGLAVDNTLDFANELLPMLVNYEITLHGFAIGVSLIFVIVGIVFIIKSMKWSDNKRFGYATSDVCFFIFVVSCIVAGVALAMAIDNAIGLIGWSTAPTAKAIEYVLNMGG